MFEFELQTLLDARQAQEEKKQMELAEAVRHRESQKEILENIKNKRLQMIKEYCNMEGRPVAGEHLFLYSENIARYREMGEMQKEQCRQAEADAEEKRLALIEATKQKKMLDKLKEKKFMAYLQKLHQTENKELDESAILRFGGNSL